ncbi:hyaluronan mediated motility receptor-like [Ptychodera flava]|uniref:hyaluronan mediated motility receptor-like n=1 Tax=Ptychodera flava TaxID=63121 RepID=UPI003969E45B
MYSEGSKLPTVTTRVPRFPHNTSSKSKLHRLPSTSDSTTGSSVGSSRGTRPAAEQSKNPRPNFPKTKSNVKTLHRFKESADTTFNGVHPKTGPKPRFTAKGSLIAAKPRLTPMEMKKEISNLTEELQRCNEELSCLKQENKKLHLQEDKDKENCKDMKDRILELESSVESQEKVKQELVEQIDIYRNVLQSLHVDPVSLAKLYSQEEEAELEVKKEAAKLESKESIDLMNAEMNSVLAT